MKLVHLISIVWLASLANLFAQANGVDVELSCEQGQFLSGEDLIVSVRVVNSSGQTLKLGREEDWLTFSVQSRDNFIVSKLGNPPVSGEFSVDSSFAATKRVNLAPYFTLSRSGPYRVTAKVKIPQWNQEVTSKAKEFEIIKGTKLADFKFGVPLAENETNKAPEVRHYVLEQAVYLKQMKLYLRLTNASGGRTYKLFPIDVMTSFTQPEAQLDRYNNLHLLHQTGARSFNYCVVNPEAQILTRETYDYTDTRPVLKFNDEGRVRVFGGVRRISSTDIPAPESSLTQTDVAPNRQ